MKFGIRRIKCNKNVIYCTELLKYEDGCVSDDEDEDDLYMTLDLSYALVFHLKNKYVMIEYQLRGLSC